MGVLERSQTEADSAWASNFFLLTRHRARAQAGVGLEHIDQRL
jgi:hypothetical protein